MAVDGRAGGPLELLPGPQLVGEGQADPEVGQVDRLAPDHARDDPVARGELHALALQTALPPDA